MPFVSLLMCGGENELALELLQMAVLELEEQLHSEVELAIVLRRALRLLHVPKH